jgi:hypothetical protein
MILRFCSNLKIVFWCLYFGILQYLGGIPLNPSACFFRDDTLLSIVISRRYLRAAPPGDFPARVGGSAQEAASRGVNRSGLLASGLLIDWAIDLSMP